MAKQLKRHIELHKYSLFWSEQDPHAEIAADRIGKRFIVAHGKVYIDRDSNTIAFEIWYCTLGAFSCQFTTLP